MKKIFIFLCIIFIVNCGENKKSDMPVIYQEDIDAIKNKFDNFVVDDMDYSNKWISKFNSVGISLRLQKKDDYFYTFEIGTMDNKSDHKRTPVVINTIFRCSNESVSAFNSYYTIPQEDRYNIKTECLDYEHKESQKSINAKAGERHTVFFPKLSGSCDFYKNNTSIILEEFKANLKSRSDCDYQPLTEEQKKKIQKNKVNTQDNINEETELSSTENVFNSDSENNSDNKFSISSMIASLRASFNKTLQSDASADLHGTYSQKEFQDCCFEGEETTEKYHHLQLASPINVTGESDNSPEGEKVTITVDEVQISDIEGVKDGEVIDVHCDQLYFSPNAHYALSVYCSTPQKAEEQKEEQTNNESNFLSRESEKSYQKEGAEEVKNSTISKPPSQDEKVNSTQKIASVENDEKKLQGTTNNLSKSKFNSSSKLIRNMLNLAIDNGGINHESEIQEIISQITSSPKNQNGNKKLARDFNDKGHDFLKDEDFDSAVEMFEKAHQANPSDIEIANNLGFANMKADNLDAAEKYLIETLVLSPTRATAWANLGDLYALKDEESKAVACYANMYRFSKNRLNTDKFMRKLNESEYIESLKSARDKAILSANSWFYFR